MLVLVVAVGAQRLSPLPNQVRKELCSLDHLYRGDQLEEAIEAIDKMGCTKGEWEEVEFGYYLVTGSRIVPSE